MTDHVAQPLHIRPAHLDDALALAQLSGELGYPVAADAMRERLIAVLASTNHAVCVATATDGGILGWAVGERRRMLEANDKAELTGLVVGAASRRSGVGKALVEAIEQWAIDQGLASICVRSNVTRAESHPFYRSIGYAHKKTQHVYEKALPPAPATVFTAT